MTDMSTLPKDDPRDDAFAAYKDSDDYANTRRWALYEEHVDGSLWAAFIAGYAARHSPTPEPIQMLLYCPRCGEQHVDEPHADWTNPPHRSHLCHGCGCIWRPADVPTNGVRVISTAGMADNWLASTSEAIGNARAATPKPSPEELSYRWAHEDAVEMGYPSLTEALEHLSELRASPTPEPSQVEAVARAIHQAEAGVKISDADWNRMDAMPKNRRFHQAREAIAAMTPTLEPCRLREALERIAASKLTPGSRYNERMRVEYESVVDLARAALSASPAEPQEVTEAMIAPPKSVTEREEVTGREAVRELDLHISALNAAHEAMQSINQNNEAHELYIKLEGLEEFRRVLVAAMRSAASGGDTV